MPVRNHEYIASYFYNQQHPRYEDVHKFDMVKGAVKGAHSVTTAINRIIWPTEPTTATESVTIDQFLNNIPAAVTESTTLSQFSNGLPAAVTESTTLSQFSNGLSDTTITQFLTSVTSGIENTINFNDTVMSVVTDETRDTMVNVINNAVNITNEISNPTTSANVIQNAVTTMVNLIETTTPSVMQDTTIAQFSAGLPAAVTEETTITQLLTNMTSLGIENTINLNDTVMGVLTNQTQDTMVNVINNAVNLTNEISNPTISTNVIQNAVTSMVNLIETTPSVPVANSNITNEVQMIVTTEHTSTMANVVKKTTELVTDTISTTAKKIGCEYLHNNENEGSQKGTNALLVLILLVLLFICAFLVYIYIRHKRMGKTTHQYQVKQEENTSTVELQHEQIQIEQASYVKHTET